AGGVTFPTGAQGRRRFVRGPLRPSTTCRSARAVRSRVALTVGCEAVRRPRTRADDRQVRVRSLEAAHVLGKSGDVLARHEVRGPEQVGRRTAEPRACPRRPGEWLVELLRDSLPSLLLREARPHVVAARNPTRRIIGPAPERPKAELDTSAH